MAQIRHLFFVCGEASGDLHAGTLAKKILEIDHGIRISGVGGDILRAAGANIFSDIKDLGVMGLFDVLRKLPRFLALKDLVINKIREEKPDAVILVDFSGFNLRLAKEINRSVPVIYYVSPQVWASRPGRIKTIKDYVDRMVVLFKFEEEFYERRGVRAAFTGHPLLDIVKPSLEKDEFMRRFDLHANKTTLVLLPGSRKQEVERILPIMLESCRHIIKGVKNAQLVIAKSSQVELDAYDRIVEEKNIDLTIIEGKTYDCLNIADFCLVASGTATLETAIMQKPMAVIYRMNPLNYFLYRPQVKLPYIGMVNIVAGKKIVPEFIQFQAKPKEISREVLRILGDAAERERIKKDLALVKSQLGEKGAAMRAAKVILDFLSSI